MGATVRPREAVGNGLLNPLAVVGTIFLAQFVIWFLLMPDQPTIPAAAPRYASAEAALRYVVYLASFLGAIVLGSALPRTLGLRRAVTAAVDDGQLRALDRIAIVSLLLSLVGELVYTWAILRNPHLIIEASMAGDLASAGGMIQAGVMPGVTTMVNLFTVPTAIYSAFAFHRAVSGARRRTARRMLVAIGVVAVLHGIALSARMYVVWYAATVLGGYLLFADRRRIRRGAIAAMIAGVAALVWLGATLRDGGRYAYANGVGLFAPETQRRVYDVMVQGYLAAEFNNAMITFGCEPTMDVVGTSMFRAASFLGLPGGRFTRCAESSEFGTQNSMSLWWQDLGWFGIIYAVSCGLWIGAAYVVARRHARSLGAATFFYLVSYPGLVSLLRVNFFGLAPFLYPVAFLFVALSFHRAVGRPLR
ncbi:MAG TPA: hypothetical protein VFI52_16160 [Gemmatimonadaceae bacterium]|nr:hypothetical protein [Gemmatimonadaceae bacterium]